MAGEPLQWRYGYELALEVGLQSGSLYPILVRLSDRGLLESQWATDQRAGRPPRHLYRLTGEGLEYAATHDGGSPVPSNRARRRPELRGAS
jgi:DNA-binding PadR family transcriptional regulator